MEDLKRQRNILSTEIAALKKQSKDASSKLKIVKDIPNKIKKEETKTITLKEKVREIMLELPNILHDSVPVGVDDTKNKTERTWGDKPKFKFKVKSHVDLLEEKDLFPPQFEFSRRLRKALDTLRVIHGRYSLRTLLAVNIKEFINEAQFFILNIQTLVEGRLKVS